MRNLDNARTLPRRAHVGSTVPTGRERLRGTDPGRHFTDVAVENVTPSEISLDLEPFGEREVMPD